MGHMPDGYIVNAHFSAHQVATPILEMSAADVAQWVASPEG